MAVGLGAYHQDRGYFTDFAITAQCGYTAPGRGCMRKGSFSNHGGISMLGCLLALGRGTPLKTFLIILLLCISGCSWFHRKPHAPDPTELIVVGAPVGSLVFVDGVQSGQAKELAKQPQEVEVTPGTHVLEVRVGETVAYRENTYVTPGERRVISVLSGTGRN